MVRMQQHRYIVVFLEDAKRVVGVLYITYGGKIDTDTDLLVSYYFVSFFICKVSINMHQVSMSVMSYE